MQQKSGGDLDPATVPVNRFNYWGLERKKAPPKGGKGSSVPRDYLRFSSGGPVVKGVSAWMGSISRELGSMPPAGGVERAVGDSAVVETSEGEGQNELDSRGYSNEQIVY